MLLCTDCSSALSLTQWLLQQTEAWPLQAIPAAAPWTRKPLKSDSIYTCSLCCCHNSFLGCSLFINDWILLKGSFRGHQVKLECLINVPSLTGWTTQGDTWQGIMKCFGNGCKVWIFLLVTSHCSYWSAVPAFSPRHLVLWARVGAGFGGTHRLALGRVLRGVTWRCPALIGITLLPFLAEQRYKDVLQWVLQHL